MYGPKGPFLLRYGSRDSRHIDFPRVDGLSTDTPVLGRHSMKLFMENKKLLKNHLKNERLCLTTDTLSSI